MHVAYLCIWGSGVYPDTIPQRYTRITNSTSLQK